MRQLRLKAPPPLLAAPPSAHGSTAAPVGSIVARLLKLMRLVFAALVMVCCSTVGPLLKYLQPAFAAPVTGGLQHRRPALAASLTRGCSTVARLLKHRR
jgi:hypothetical protein